MVAVTTMTGREFNRNVSKAKRLARNGPVVITSRGRAAHVLLTMEEYVALAKQDESIVEMLAMPEAADIDFDPPKVGSWDVSARGSTPAAQLLQPAGDPATHRLQSTVVRR